VRKDMRFGLAIGGVLLAVVVVYVIVISGGNKPIQPTAGVGGEGQAVPMTVAVEPAQGQSSQPPVAAELPKPAAAEQASRGAVAAAGGTDPFAPAPAAPAAARTGAHDGVDWNSILSGDAKPVTTATPQVPSGKRNARKGKRGAEIAKAEAKAGSQDSAVIPLSATEPPPPAPVTPAASDGGAPAVTFEPPPQQGPTVIHAVQPAGQETTDAAPSQAPAGGPTVRPAAGATRTHTVQRNETLSSIAAAAYGSANFWPHIARANPNLDPKRLRPGMTLNLPDAEAVKTGADTSAQPSALAASNSNPDAQTASHTIPPKPAAQPIDARTEYRVKSGDSLYKIAMNLYGRADHVDQIYDWNKQLIGPDPHKLKLGMVLKLHDPPTQAQASTR